MLRMKALKDFRGRPGEGNDRMVSAGGEFSVENQQRADYLEGLGFAVAAAAKAASVPSTKMEARPQNKMEPAPENKAADTGPLVSPGGEIGEDPAQSSLGLVRQPQRRRSRKPAGSSHL